MSKHNLAFKTFLVIAFCESVLFGCNSKSIDQNIEVIYIDGAKPENLSIIVEEIEYVVLENPNKPFVKADKLFVLMGGLFWRTFGAITPY